MKQGKSLMELAKTLTETKQNSKDFIVPTGQLKAGLSDGELVLKFTNGAEHQYAPNKHAHGQLATYSDIPKAYYDRLRAETPQLLVQNVNHGLTRQLVDANGKPVADTRMVRTTGGNVRALLSSKYRRLDSIDLLESVLPVMQEGDFEVESSEVTEQRMYLKALTPKLKGEVKKGDVVQFGLVISSSDVGAGSLKVEPLIYRLVCLNGMISNTAIRKFHVGRSQAAEDVYELLSDRTKELSDAAFWAQVQDVVRINMRPEVFEKELNRLREAVGVPITNFDLETVVELAMDRVKVGGEKTKMSIVEYLASGADGAGMNKWGLANAFTYAAQADHVDYDESVELERAGSRVIELSRTDWAKIAEKEVA